MVGETLGSIRARIESLAAPDGEYRVVCGRTGMQPVPVSTTQFPNRERAEKAAQAATAYRAVLRRWDPRAPCYDFIACEVPSRQDPTTTSVQTTGHRANASLTGFCHDVAAAVFEALSAEGFGDIESAIMDVYCESADVITDPDDLCLHLLATLSAELDERLSPSEQASVLRTAASGFPGPTTAGRPLTQTFERLQQVDIIGDYTIETRQEMAVGQQSWTVTVVDYALPDGTDAMVTLPIVIDLLQRLPRARLTLGDVRRIADGIWRFELDATEDGPTAGLTRIQLSG